MIFLIADSTVTVLWTDGQMMVSMTCFGAINGKCDDVNGNIFSKDHVCLKFLAILLKQDFYQILSYLTMGSLFQYSYASVHCNI